MKSAFVLSCLILLAILASVKVDAKGGPKKTPPGLAKKEGSPAKKTGAPEGADSYSRSKVTGWFRIHVVGTGKKCLVKEKDKTKSEKEQFGEFATSEAFVQFYGEPECEPGDKGVAKAKIRASALAEAAAIGPECVAKVITSVMEAEVKTHKVHTDVKAGATGEAGGDAQSLCEVY